MNKTYKERCIEYAFKELYILACLEQARFDDRLYSPEMKNIKELREWYKSTQKVNNE